VVPVVCKYFAGVHWHVVLVSTGGVCLAPSDHRISGPAYRCSTDRHGFGGSFTWVPEQSSVPLLQLPVPLLQLPVPLLQYQYPYCSYQYPYCNISTPNARISTPIAIISTPRRLVLDRPARLGRPLHLGARAKTGTHSCANCDKGTDGPQQAVLMTAAGVRCSVPKTVMGVPINGNKGTDKRQEGY
jgi:hypothetical protein